MQQPKHQPHHVVDNSIDVNNPATSSTSDPSSSTDRKSSSAPLPSNSTPNPPSSPPMSKHILPFHGARSRFIDTRAFLLLRLVFVAFLVAHLAFFISDTLLSTTRYTHWAFVLATLTLLVAVFASLLDVINDNHPFPNHHHHQHYHHQQFVDIEQPQFHPPHDQSHSTSKPPSRSIHDQQQQQQHHEIRSSRPLAYILALIHARLHQVTLSVLIYSTLIYWLFLRSSPSPSSITYAECAINVVTPLTIFTNAIFSRSAAFQFLIVLPPYIVFHGAFILVYIFTRSDASTYSYLDRDTLPRSIFIARLIGLLVGMIITPVVVTAVVKIASFLLQKNEEKKNRPVGDVLGGATLTQSATNGKQSKAGTNKNDTDGNYQQQEQENDVHVPLTSRKRRRQKTDASTSTSQHSPWWSKTKKSRKNLDELDDNIINIESGALGGGDVLVDQRRSSATSPHVKSSSGLGDNAIKSKDALHHLSEDIRPRVEAERDVELGPGVGVSGFDDNGSTSAAHTTSTLAQRHARPIDLSILSTARRLDEKDKTIQSVQTQISNETDRPSSPPTQNKINPLRLSSPPPLPRVSSTTTITNSKAHRRRSQYQGHGHGHSLSQGRLMTIVSSRSDSSLGSWGSRRETSWTALDSPTPRVEDEYFKMPAVLAAQGLERDIIKLNTASQQLSPSSSSLGVLARVGSASKNVIRRSSSAVQYGTEDKDKEKEGQVRRLKSARAAARDRRVRTPFAQPDTVVTATQSGNDEGPDIFKK